MNPATWWRRTSFRARITTLVAVAVGVAVALASLASYFAVRHQLFSQFDSTLESEGVAATHVFTTDQGAYPQAALQFVAVTGNGYTPIYPQGSPHLPVSAAQAEIALSPGSARIDSVTGPGRVHYRVITIGLPGEGQPLAIQVARPLTDIIHSLSTLRLTLWLVTLAGIAVAIILGWIVGRTTIRPVERLTAAAEHVAATQDLSATIVDDGNDELARLARAFNSMLRALGESRREQAQLISDAGHELRTPLTSLRTNIEVLQRVPDLSGEDRTNLLHDVNAQLEELTTLVGDVVELARQDEQSQAEPMEVRLDDIVSRAIERARRRAPSVTFEVSLTPGSVRAHPALLERAVLNVLDNAAKWSPSGARVTTSLVRGDRWVLTVADDGPGIPASDLPHVFDRFYRAAAARPMPGSGLGLAIVRQIVTAHDGTVDITCPPSGGTVVRIELPTVPENEPETEGDSSPDWGSPAEDEHDQGAARPTDAPVVGPGAMPRSGDEHYSGTPDPPHARQFG